MSKEIDCMELITRRSKDLKFTVKDLAEWIMEERGVSLSAARSRAKTIVTKLPCERISNTLFKLIETVAISKKQVVVKESTAGEVRAVIDYLNQELGKRLKPTKEYSRLINARIADGFVFEDFKRVIDIKKKEWLGSEMQKFLRPETLFSQKFQSYLNQLEGGGKAQQMARYDFTKYIKGDTE